MEQEIKPEILLEEEEDKYFLFIISLSTCMFFSRQL